MAEHNEDYEEIIANGPDGLEKDAVIAFEELHNAMTDVAEAMASKESERVRAFKALEIAKKLPHLATVLEARLIMMSQFGSTDEE